MWREAIVPALVGQTAVLPHFFCHMFDLSSLLSFHYTPCVLWCIELNKVKICFQQTRSYIIYFFNSYSSVVAGVRSQSLLPSRPQGRQKISLLLTFYRAGYCLCCREKLCGLQRPTCLWVCLSAGEAMELFSYSLP